MVGVLSEIMEADMSWGGIREPELSDASTSFADRTRLDQHQMVDRVGAGILELGFSRSSQARPRDISPGYCSSWLDMDVLSTCDSRVQASPVSASTGTDDEEFCCTC